MTTARPSGAGGADASAATGALSAPSAPSLVTRGLRRTFGGVAAIDGVDLALPDAGTITGLIGPNGAGKTTLFNLLSGLTRPDGGRIELFGVDVTRRRPDEIARLGAARTFQNLELFGSLTVLENVLVARHRHTRAGTLTALLRLPAGLREERVSRAAATVALERLGIAHLADRLATSLPFGDQRRVEVARALATEPRLLLLDEPLAGLAAADAEALLDLVRGIATEGVTVLLVEHDVRAVMGLCGRVVVLNQGKVIADGTPAQVQDDPAVIAAYLGAGLDDLPDPLPPGSAPDPVAPDGPGPPWSPLGAAPSGPTPSGAAPPAAAPPGATPPGTAPSGAPSGTTPPGAASSSAASPKSTSLKAASPKAGSSASEGRP